MSSYFDQIEQSIGEAVGRLAHKRWHVRLLRMVRRHPGAAVAIAALVIAAPAVGAVTHWYGIGAPNHPQSETRDFGVGNAIPGKARLLSLRVPDPQGGPPWGMRIVQTQSGYCQEVGRVENGRIGSLGIDDYWHNDHLFHPYPANWAGQSCGSGGGGGGVGVFNASANIPKDRNGTQVDGCAINPAITPHRPRCPHGSLRIIMFMTLQQTKSIAYRAPDGSTQSERSGGDNGTYLLVFQLNAATCRYYLSGQLTSGGVCKRSARRSPGPTNPLSAAIKSITSSDGKSCAATGPALFSNCRSH